MIFVCRELQIHLNYYSPTKKKIILLLRIDYDYIYQGGDPRPNQLKKKIESTM